MKSITLGKSNNSPNNNINYSSDNRKYPLNEKALSNKSNFFRKLTSAVHEMIDVMSYDQLTYDNVTDVEDNHIYTNTDTELFDTSYAILVNSTKTNNVSPANICKVLSTYAPLKVTKKSKSPPNEKISINGRKYRLVNTKMIYSISAYNLKNSYSLIDRVLIVVLQEIIFAS